MFCSSATGLALCHARVDLQQSSLQVWLLLPNLLHMNMQLLLCPSQLGEVWKCTPVLAAGCLSESYLASRAWVRWEHASASSRLPLALLPTSA